MVEAKEVFVFEADDGSRVSHELFVDGGGRLAWRLLSVEVFVDSEDLKGYLVIGAATGPVLGQSTLENWFNLDGEWLFACHFKKVFIDGLFIYCVR